MKVIKTDKLTQAERKLSGKCVLCGDIGYIHVWFEEQISDYPYKQACSCDKGFAWARPHVHGIRD